MYFPQKEKAIAAAADWQVSCIINTMDAGACHRLALISQQFKEESNLELQ